MIFENATSTGLRVWARGLVAMIPALGAGGPGFKSRLAPPLLLLMNIFITTFFSAVLAMPPPRNLYLGVNLQANSSNVTASPHCELSPYKYNNSIAYYNLTYGIIQGFYPTEAYPLATGCINCKQIARPVGNIQAQVYLLYSNKDKYLGDWTKYNVVSKVTQLFELY